MSKRTEICGNKFGTLFVGETPEGMTLDVMATERGMQVDLDNARQEWLDENPEPDCDSVEPRKYIEWDDARQAAFAGIGERLSQSESWYNDNYIWIPAE